AHIARRIGLFDAPIFEGIGPSHEAADDLAPVAHWGRDDSLGQDPFSARGTALGRVEPVMWATCFGAPPETWSCAGDDEPRASVAPGSIGLTGIGEAQPPEQEPVQWLRRRPARVVAGPVAVAANIPRWAVVVGIHEIVDQLRVCYARALLDD